MTEEDIRQLELYLEEKDSIFQQSLRPHRGSISEDDYRERLRRHNEEMQGLWDKVNREKTRLTQSNDNTALSMVRPDTEGYEEDGDAIKSVREYLVRS